MSEFVPKVADIAWTDSSAARLLDKGNHFVDGAYRVYELRFVAQNSARGCNKQGGFDMKQSDAFTMELSNQIELVVTQGTGCEGQLNANTSNRFHIVREGGSLGGALFRP